MVRINVLLHLYSMFKRKNVCGFQEYLRKKKPRKWTEWILCWLLSLQYFCLKKKTIATQLSITVHHC